MSKSTAILASGAVAASLLLSNAALALNPQPEPPSRKMMKQNKSLGGPDTKGSWKCIHDVEKTSKSKGGWKSFHEVDKRKSK